MAMFYRPPSFSITDAVGVRNSLTPSGVEHSKLFAAPIRIGSSEFVDAVRR
jgi:hypothetical protein